MFKLKEVIENKDRKKIYSLAIPYGIVLDKEFDIDKDEMSISEVNEINNELKERWIKWLLKLAY